MTKRTKIAVAAAAIAAGLLCDAQQSGAAIIINEVYSGGGGSNAAAAYKKDYVELYNTGSTAVDVTGYSLDYGSATGNFASSASNRFTLPSGATIAGNGYLLVALGAVGTTGADLAGDYTTTNLSMSATTGKVRLVDSTFTTTNDKTAIPAAGILDVVGWGTADLFEGAVAPAPTSVAYSLTRNDSHSDTDNNSVDFTNISPPTLTAGNPVPEPASFGLIAGAAALGLARRRRA